jgi:hypothetical protein
LLGPLPGKKAQIARCVSLQNDPAKSKALRENVKEADKKGSMVGASTLNLLTKSFRVAQRETIDMAVTKFLYANGIPFNVLRSPQFSEMIITIRNGPKDYKDSSSERQGQLFLMYAREMWRMT